MRKGTAIVAMLLAISCRKTQGPPDPNYDQGAKLYQQLYVSKLDDAYGDPQMDTVVGYLQKVDRNSVDAPAADALLDTIKRGRDGYAKTRAERDKLQTAVQPPVNAAPNIDPVKILGLDRPVDAGVPPDPFGPGASITEINAASGGCLVPGEPFHENDTNRTGTIYRLSNVAACVQRLPGFVGQVVLVSDGRIYRRAAEAEAVIAVVDGGTRSQDGGTPARPDAGAAGARPGGTTSATAATDAGPENYLYIPGGPMPPGMVPDGGFPDAGGY